MSPLLFKIILIVFGISTATYGLWYIDKQAISDAKFLKATGLFWLLSRFGIFVIYYGILGNEVAGDVAGYYYPQALSILEGKHIYQDFVSSYAPLFPYILAGIISIWDSAISIVLVAILLEGWMLAYWLRVSPALASPNNVQMATILYVTSPLILLNIIINGQNQIWIGFLIAAAVLLAIQRRTFWSGVVLGAAVVLVKFLVLLFVPALFFLSKNRKRWIIGFSILPVLIYGLLAIQGIDFLVPFKAEGLLTSAGNIPFVVSSLFGLRTGLITQSTILQIFFYSLLLSGCWTIIFLLFKTNALKHPSRLPSVIGLFLILFLLLSNKSQTSYLVMAWFPICLILSYQKITKKTWLIFSILSVVTIIEPALWYRWDFISLDAIWSVHSSPTERICGLVIAGLDLLLISSYLVLLNWCWKVFRIPQTIYLQKTLPNS